MELDSDELAIDEVESLHEAAMETDSDHGYGGAFGSAGHASDPMLSSLHNCLKGGAILNIPMCYVEGEVLFPGQTLYLKVTAPKILAAIDRAVDQADASYILGVLSVYWDPHHGEMRFTTTGTTAEILQLRQLEDGLFSVLTRGQQRFRPRGQWTTVEPSSGEIQIIHEDVPLRAPRDAVGKQAPLRSSLYLTDIQNKRKALDILSDDSDELPDDSFTSEFSATRRRLNESALASSSWGSKQTDELPRNADKSEFTFQCGHPRLSMFPNSNQSVNKENSEAKVANTIISDIPTHEGVMRKEGSIRSLYQVSSGFCPSWVYRMYDPYRLAEKLAGMWKKIVGELNIDRLLKKPDMLSFHIASKIPVSLSARQELLDIDGISRRLGREIELLESLDCVQCKTCQAVVAMKSDVFAMSSDGPLGVYLDSCGYVHDIVTMLKVKDLRLVGHPSEERSWFPGYSWTIAYCTNCECKIGWYFTATKKSLNLQSFWVIRFSQVADGHASGSMKYSGL